MYLPRDLEKELAKWIRRHEIVLLKGPRQSGKTTLLKHLHSLYGGSYINLDIPSLRTALERDPLRFAKKQQPLFFDEIGNVPDAGKYLKLLYDETKCKIICTGSGAFEVKCNVLGPLVGRAVSFELLPLSFSEYLLWCHPRVVDLHRDGCDSFFSFIEQGKVPPEPFNSQEIRQALDDYLRWGGYPAVVLEKEEKERVISSIVECALHRDIFLLFDIREKSAFSSFINLLAAQTGGLLRLSSFPLSFRTAERYLSALVMEFLVDLIRPFYMNLSTELKKTPKLYFLDLGILNFLAGQRVSRAVLLENFAFLELRRRYSRIAFWRTESKAEVDFVIQGDFGLVPVEVKTSCSRVPRALKSFIHTYGVKRAVVLSDTYRVEQVDDCVVLFFPIWCI